MRATENSSMSCNEPASFQINGEKIFFFFKEKKHFHCLTFSPLDGQRKSLVDLQEDNHETSPSFPWNLPLTKRPTVIFIKIFFFFYWHWSKSQIAPFFPFRAKTSHYNLLQCCWMPVFNTDKVHRPRLFHTNVIHSGLWNTVKCNVMVVSVHFSSAHLFSSSNQNTVAGFQPSLVGSSRATFFYL